MIDPGTSPYPLFRRVDPKARGRRTGSRPGKRRTENARLRRGIDPEQFAALHGPNTLVFGFPRYIFRDPELDAWAQEVGSILRDPDRRDSCMRRHLSAEDYERARSDME